MVTLGAPGAGGRLTLLEFAVLSCVRGSKARGIFTYFPHGGGIPARRRCPHLARRIRRAPLVSPARSRGARIRGGRRDGFVALRRTRAPLGGSVRTASDRATKQRSIPRQRARSRHATRPGLEPRRVAAPRAARRALVRRTRLSREQRCSAAADRRCRTSSARDSLARSAASVRGARSSEPLSRSLAMLLPAAHPRAACVPPRHKLHRARNCCARFVKWMAKTGVYICKNHCTEPYSSVSRLNIQGSRHIENRNTFCPNF